MSHKSSHRVGAPRRFSSQLRQSRLSPQVSNYGTIDPPSQRSNDELEHLLEDQYQEDDRADSDGLYPPNCCWTADTPQPAGNDVYRHDEWPVYDNIHKIRHEVINSIDDPYSLDQLRAPRMNISVIRPLVDQFYSTQDLSIVYCLLVNRTQFIREQAYATHHQTVNLTRALLCEIVAEKILRRYNEHNPGPKGLLKLANILVAGFEPFQHAPDDVVKNNYHIMHYVRQKGGQMEKGMTALEVAIVSESKSFLASAACQKVVDAIYRGKVVYTPNSFIDILPDYWKRRPISLYDPRRGPLLNQYRMAVPRTRNWIEVGHFLVLLVLYVVIMEGRDTRQTTDYKPLEVIFDFYAWGWILDQVASMLEHGWSVYTQNLWSFLDVMFMTLFTFYFVVRMYALGQSDPDQAQEWARLALDALSCAAPILIPRLAFNLLSENLVFLCLRDMLANFIALVFLAAWCFIGFLLTLKWLHNGLHEPVTIGKWMVWIWFGLDGTGIQQSPGFHWLLGPTIMIMFAFLGNTLFVTILVSMLSNTFSNISANAVQEMQYRRSVLTFEGVKADAIFAYMPPLNLFAVLFILPLKFALSPRWFHKINVFTVKLCNAPLLILINSYERRTLWISKRYKRLKASHVDWNTAEGPRVTVSWWEKAFKHWDLSRFSAHGDILAVFDQVTAQTTQDMEREEGIGRSLREGLWKQFDRKRKGISTPPATSRRNSPDNMNTSMRNNGTSASSSAVLATASLRKEFASDSSDQENADTHDVPAGHHKISRSARKDSLIDYHESHPDMSEANARLHRLEESVQSMSRLLSRLVEVNEDQVDAEGTLSPVDEDYAEG